MKRTFLLAAVIVTLVGGLAAAQCNCTSTEAAGPCCYTAFWEGEEIHFKLIVPAEYFLYCSPCDTPLITGWWIETMDGIVVYQDMFPEVPKGHWLEMTWDQNDSGHYAVPGGYYKIVVHTTTAGEFTNYVQIFAKPCFCCCCWQRLCSCPCGVPFGEPYVVIYPSERNSISIHIGLKCP